MKELIDLMRVISGQAAVEPKTLKELIEDVPEGGFRIYTNGLSYLVINPSEPTAYMFGGEPMRPDVDKGYKLALFFLLMPEDNPEKYQEILSRLKPMALSNEKAKEAIIGLQIFEGVFVPWLDMPKDAVAGLKALPRPKKTLH